MGTWSQKGGGRDHETESLLGQENCCQPGGERGSDGSICGVMKSWKQFEMRVWGWGARLGLQIPTESGRSQEGPKAAGGGLENVPCLSSPAFGCK